jgi:hypothetical protein
MIKPSRAPAGITRGTGFCPPWTPTTLYNCLWI